MTHDEKIKLAVKAAAEIVAGSNAGRNGQYSKPDFSIEADEVLRWIEENDIDEV